LEKAIELHREGNVAGASALYEQILQREPKNASALHYLGLARLQQGLPQVAEELLTRAVQLDTKNVNALCDLGTLKARQERNADALKVFNRALELNANHLDALNNAATCLIALGRPKEASGHLLRLTRLEPNSSERLTRLGDLQFRLGEVDEAVATLQQALVLAPDSEHARLLLGRIFEAIGRFREARLQYAAIVRRSPNATVPLARLLELADDAADPEWVSEAIRLASCTDRPVVERSRLQLALGHYFDRQQNYDRAYHFVHAANDAIAERSPFDSDAFSEAMEHLRDVCTPEFFGALARRTGSNSERPLFIVGMPRSGTTLTEQILASHPEVAAAGELSAIFSIGAQVENLVGTGRKYPEAVADLTGDQIAALAEQYLAVLDKASSNSRYVTDKLPFNFMHLGLIVVLFPRARILHCVRHPLDTCLSCYFTSFSDNIQFASNFSSLGRYFRDYARLMAHWRNVLPSKILEVRYESLVSDTESVVRTMLDYCDLAWNDTCLEFFQTPRAVRTPSRWQVRQRVYGTSVGRWRHYAQHLQPLREAIGDSACASSG
jgi:tetratricopeptide (TPR) repeat protein